MFILEKMDQIQQAIEPCKEFCKDSIRLVKRCTKPDRKGKLGNAVLSQSFAKVKP